MIRFVLGLAVGAVVALAAAGWLGQARAEWLSRYRIALEAPPVPPSILSRVRVAEAASYAEAPAWRRGVEHAQDAAAILVPRLAYALDWSVGPYRIKARTVEDLLSWAVGEGYLALPDGAEGLDRHAIAYFAEQPVLGDWEAQVYLAWLRASHPGLAALGWEEIAADPALVAKLYSGYMGAGGAWQAWRADLEPGPVARRRMGLGAGGDG